MWKEDDRRDPRARAKCYAVHDEVPSINVIVAAKVLHAAPA
jgi:hypothetical protein